MRQRPNEDPNLPQTSTVLENDLYRALRRTFEHVLHTGDHGKYSLRNEFYVSAPEVESVVGSFCTGTTNESMFFIGPTGIGKSTLLRHLLEINRPPVIRGDSLILIYSLNQRGTLTVEAMREQIGAVIKEAAWKLKGDGEDHLSEQDYKGLRDFIKDTSPELLNDADLDLSRSSVERTKELSKSKKYEYQFSQVLLKYFAKNSPEIRRIVFILDDVEMKTKELREAAIRNALETKECLSNFGPNRQVTIRLLIALRPETYDWISRLDEIKTASFQRVTYKTPVSLNDIFQRRFEAVYTVDDYTHIRDKAKLDTAKDVLNAVGEGLAGRYTARLVKLCNLNIRDALKSFSTVISNRRWLQRDAEFTPHFTVDEYGFAVNRASVLRALGMGASNVYTGLQTCLVNILWNTREQNSDIVVLYIVKFFLCRSNQPISLPDLHKSLTSLLWEQFSPDLLHELVRYAKDNLLLLDAYFGPS